MCCQFRHETPRSNRYAALEILHSSLLTKTATLLLGDRIIVVVQKARSSADSGVVSAAGAPQAKVRRGDIRHAVIVRIAKKVQRKDGSIISFGDNACALIGKNGEPLGTRIAGESFCVELSRDASSDSMEGVVGAELRDKHHSKILSLANMHV